MMSSLVGPGLVGPWKSWMRRTPRQIKLLLFFSAAGFIITSFLLLKRTTVEQRESHLVQPVIEHSKATTSVDHSYRPVVWIYANKELAMSHVSVVFNRLGYRVRQPGEPWDVMWSHGYPFGTFGKDLQNLKPHQKINHFPGTACFVSKPKLATQGFDFTPKAFRIPDESEMFLEEVTKRPNTLWVRKNNKHRGIQIKKPKDISLRDSGAFVQEFITNPILIDGRKFDIGIYTLITSIDPLVVYIYEEEILLRFCSKDYLPFNENDKRQYVVDDYYTPSWEIPTMEPLINKHGLTHKEALNYVLRQKGFKSDKMWEDAYFIIQKVLRHCEESVLNRTVNYVSKRNFFEFVRFDFIIDENFRTWLMEVNLSPNLSSGHTAGNRNMYEQLVYNVLHMVGLSRGTEPGLRYNGEFESVMFVNEHDIQIHMDSCVDGTCSDCKMQICQLCKQCRGKYFEFTLKTTFLEFLGRRNFQRLIPDPFDSCSGKVENRLLKATQLSNKRTRVNNELMEAWFYGKCCQYPQWCR